MNHWQGSRAMVSSMTAAMRDWMASSLPALGTHSPMTSEQIHEMFPGVPESLFRVHNWRTGITTVGEVPASFVKEVSEGAVDFPWPAQVANLLGGCSTGRNH